MFQYNLACVYHAVHREAEAIATLWRVLALDAAHTKARLLLGQILAAAGDADAARRALETILSLKPESPEAQRAREELRRLRSR